MPARPSPELRRALALASRVAGEAARLLRLKRHGLAAVRRYQEQQGREVKIGADGRLDRFIASGLGASSPFPVHSEERWQSGRSMKRGWGWVVDPLDGSLNFSRGIPLSCISVALCSGTVPVLGVVHDVNRLEQFQGLVGAGAWLNGRPFRIGAVRKKARAVLCTGFPVRRDYSAGALQAFVRDVQAYQKVRMFGSAGLSLAYVACGRADVYQEEGIGLWDVAAGIALVRAAGGVARCVWNGDGRTMSLWAGNRSLVRNGVPDDGRGEDDE